MTVQKMLFTLRLIVIALIAGVVGTIAMALFIKRPSPGPATGRLLLTVQVPTVDRYRSFVERLTGHRPA